MDNILEVIKAILIDSFRGIKGYLKSRVIILGIVFIILTVGLTVIQTPTPILIAIFISVIDILPFIGAGIVMIPWGIVSYLFGNKETGVGILILYVVLTILKQFIEPKVLGDQIGIRPLYTFLTTVIGALIFGPIGLMLGPLIAVVINSIVKARDRR
jgi:predicted PurR-regulated permease PerM